MVQPSTPLSEGVGTLEEYRTLAEHSAAVIKRMKDQISNAEYAHTERLYMESKAAVDGWVTQMLIEVESGGHHAEMSQNQKRTLDAASVKVQTFLEFAGGLSSADRKRDGLIVVKDGNSHSGVSAARESKSDGRAGPADRFRTIS